MTETTSQLTFETDRGASRSFWIALGLVIAIVAWMGSGYILPSGTADPGDDRATTVEPVAVSVTASQTEVVTLFFQAEGQAQPDRDTSIRSEASGDVAEVLVAKGEDVETGALIARLATTEAEAALVSAREALAQAQREFDNASDLLDRGVATVDRVSQARAALAAAEANVTASEEAIASARITAPFAGRIETLTLDEGEFVSAGSEVGRIVDNRPLTVAIQVPQQALSRISSGQTATVTFITGEEREGTVSFVGTSASTETRTFLAEIDVANEDGSIPAGISAEVLIPTGEAQAHFLHPSSVSLNPDGVLGIKAVGEGNLVEFHPISIVRAEIDGIWVTGLPENVRIITVGQGFVSAGEEVRPSAAAANEG